MHADTFQNQHMTCVATGAFLYEVAPRIVTSSLWRLVALCVDSMMQRQLTVTTTTDTCTVGCRSRLTLSADAAKVAN